MPQQGEVNQQTGQVWNNGQWVDASKAGFDPMSALNNVWDAAAGVYRNAGNTTANLAAGAIQGVGDAIGSITGPHATDSVKNANYLSQTWDLMQHLPKAQRDQMWSMNGWGQIDQSLRQVQQHQGQAAFNQVVNEFSGWMRSQDALKPLSQLVNAYQGRNPINRSAINNAMNQWFSDRVQSIKNFKPSQSSTTTPQNSNPPTQQQHNNNQPPGDNSTNIFGSSGYGSSGGSGSSTTPLNPLAGRDPSGGGDLTQDQFKTLQEYSQLWSDPANAPVQEIQAIMDANKSYEARVSEGDNDPFLSGGQHITRFSGYKFPPHVDLGSLSNMLSWSESWASQNGYQWFPTPQQLIDGAQQGIDDPSKAAGYFFGFMTPDAQKKSPWAQYGVDQQNYHASLDSMSQELFGKNWSDSGIDQTNVRSAIQSVGGDWNTGVQRLRENLVTDPTVTNQYKWLSKGYTYDKLKEYSMQNSQQLTQRFGSANTDVALQDILNPEEAFNSRSGAMQYSLIDQGIKRGGI